ncbi:pectinesterase family protein [Cohnella caldifontis]|uniref:pectinesterase family protein n=1 Tax=Cohnella caldifontis TaxID=3027471 RepID=UPI0023EB79EE|nr:pectinesterase family protein [Cohnella sp. YIM B05605]
MRHVTVAADGSGDCKSIQEAVDRIPDGIVEPTTILVKNGIYREKLFIGKPFVRLIGEDPARTIVTFGDHATKTFPNGEPYHTFNAYTAFIGGDDFTAERITFENAAGPGEQVGQALAAYVDADRAVFRECRFLGFQDTLFTGPLPPRPRDRASFGGPREGAPTRPARQYYERCHIEGDVDFIFGSATAVFDRCDIVSKRGGWISAPSTPEGVPFGYVFIGCTLIGDAAARSVYLGRPWRNFAKTVFLDCWMGEHIHPEGWSRWNASESVASVEFAEYGNRGPGASDGGTRVDWSRQLTPEDASLYTVARILGGDDGWNPSS